MEDVAFDMWQQSELENELDRGEYHIECITPSCKYICDYEGDEE